MLLTGYMFSILIRTCIGTTHYWKERCIQFWSSPIRGINRKTSARSNSTKRCTLGSMGTRPPTRQKGPNRHPWPQPQRTSGSSNARNAPNTRGFVSLCEPTVQWPPNHDRCGCNAQRDPTRGLCCTRHWYKRETFG